MKTKPILATSLLCALFVAGCSKPQPSGDVAAASPAPAPAAAPAAAPATDASGALVVAINASGAMKYDVTEITAKAGQEIKLTLTNTGDQPKAAMAHNWILLKKDADPAAFVAAAITAQATDYFPQAKMDEVLAHTKLLGPGESDTITFKAPSEPGTYNFLCSFPAHYQVGMKGTLTVQ